MRPLRVLLAEDSPINRKVAARLLEADGHQVTAVEDGEAALGALMAQTFDVVLMDVQMPKVDGLSATRALRRLEEGSARRLPVVALTAAATPEDEQACLDAGMDAHLVKPLQAATVRALIDALAASAAPPVEKEAPAGAFDEAQLMLQVGGSADLMREVVAMFLQDLPNIRAELARDLGSGDGASFRRCAHRLKGALLMLAAEPAARAAEKIELAQEGFERLVPQVLSELDALERALGEWMARTGR